MHSLQAPPVVPSLLAPAGRVALVGVGGFGRFCLDAYRQVSDISVVAAADSNLAAINVQATPDLQIDADWASMLVNPAVEVIHLATPPFLRGAIAIPALRAGKSVFCEKPLALSLEEADEILHTASQSGRAIGIDYVLRHHPAFKLLTVLASSGLFGQLRTFSLQNFAQALPAHHWMWDDAKSGGILVEHGVHFFDAYAQIAGAPARVWGTAPRREAVQVTVQYTCGALGTYYHEFAFPQAVERTHAILLFQNGNIEIDGWIPERMVGRVMAPAHALPDVVAHLQLPLRVWEDAGSTAFEVRFPDRQLAYQASIVEGMRDVVTKHRDPDHRMSVSAQDAHRSLALALAARRATETGIEVRLTE